MVTEVAEAKAQAEWVVRALGSRSSDANTSVSKLIEKGFLREVEAWPLDAWDVRRRDHAGNENNNKNKNESNDKSIDTSSRARTESEREGSNFEDDEEETSSPSNFREDNVVSEKALVRAVLSLRSIQTDRKIKQQRQRQLADLDNKVDKNTGKEGREAVMTPSSLPPPRHSRPHREETKRRISAALKGRPKSDTHREHIRQAQLVRHADKGVRKRLQRFNDGETDEGGEEGFGVGVDIELEAALVDLAVLRRDISNWLDQTEKRTGRRPELEQVAQSNPNVYKMFVRFMTLTQFVRSRKKDEEW
jgi:hypothetical protein